MYFVQYSVTKTLAWSHNRLSSIAIASVSKSSSLRKWCCFPHTGMQQIMICYYLFKKSSCLHELWYLPPYRFALLLGHPLPINIYQSRPSTSFTPMWLSSLAARAWPSFTKAGPRASKARPGMSQQEHWLCFYVDGKGGMDKGKGRKGSN